MVGLKRKLFFLLIGLLLLFAYGCSGEAKKKDTKDEEKDKVVRIGYQKNCPFVIVKGLGKLDERLDELGYKLEWKEFQAGPALVEALNAGSIDVGRTGNSPVIFAQAAGTPFVTLGAGKPKFYGSGILVPNDSNITSIQDLKGKTVSFAKGSSSHYLLIKALQNAGLQYSDITPAYLSPGDARVAFEQGDVDAMVVWDPYTASTELHANATLLTSGEGLSTDRDFFIATEAFAKKHDNIAKIIMEEVEKSSLWANENHAELVEMLAPILNLDEDSVTKAVERREYGVDKIGEEIIQEQQDIANIFYELDIIPKAVNVSDVMRK
ncbi:MULTISPECIES: sulfonate ABC transporter substrate-binding protein [unclassified Virgibacillus]|uniref:sulfonate ABC transporter substrate-binding protein n=1 Tax=unclassified Virgibacillus TaxID=2620237 RepID=UPI0024DEE947|nr:sulfonate ABC transporter substrate-binding protein [Virgibacillus sp. LDC-1]